MEDKSPGTSHITVLDVSREPLTSITATWSLVAGYLLFVCKAVLIKWESHVRSMHWMIRITEMHFYWRVMKNSTAISNLCRALSVFFQLMNESNSCCHQPCVAIKTQYYPYLPMSLPYCVVSQHLELNQRVWECRGHRMMEERERGLYIPEVKVQGIPLIL